MNPATVAKALRLPVVARKDGTFRVAGGHGTYTVRPIEGGEYTCDCLARKGCSHRLAVQFHNQQQADQLKVS